MKYNAPWDKIAKVVTISAGVLFTTIAVSLIFYFDRSERTSTYVAIAILIAVYLGSYMMSPRSYVLTKDELIIQRAIGNISIHRDEIERVELLNSNDLNWTIRTFGVGGLFGYFGRFANARLGNMTWYATNMKSPVLVLTRAGKKIILTPQTPQSFIEYYKQRVVS